MSELLPSHGRYKAAMLDDDEYAARVGLPDSSDEKRRPVDYVDYDITAAKLDNIADLLIALKATLIAVNNEGKAPKGVKFLTRPETAFDRLKRAHAREKRRLLASILTPGE